MKYIFIAVITALSCTSVFGADDWKPYFKSDQIEIQYHYADCHDETNGIHQQKVLLRFVNLTNDKKEIYFSKELTYSGSASISTDVKIYSLQLQPGEAREGLCSDKNKALFIFSKHLNLKSRELTRFDLKDIAVKTVR